MNKDGAYTYIHMHRPRDADIFEETCRDRLPDDEIYIPPHNQPLNPEDEDDVVPDQHAAFGITCATQKSREPAWRDLGLDELMAKGPPVKEHGVGLASGSGKGKAKKGAYRGLPR